MHYRRIVAVLQCPASDLVLSSEPDVALRFGIGEKTVERAHPSGVAADPVMQADYHHAPPRIAFLVKLIELVL